MDYRSKIDSAMSQIQYGWVDKDGKKHEQMQGFSDNYALQLPDELIKSKLGVCWDQVELERKLFAEQGIKIHACCIAYYDNDKCPTHTFVIYEENGKTIWYEHAWTKHAGWHEFNNRIELMHEIRETFIKDEHLTDINPQNLVIYMDYPAPNQKLGCLDFYHHFEDKRNPRFKFKDKHE